MTKKKPGKQGGKRVGAGRKKTTGRTTKTLSCGVDRPSYDQVLVLAANKQQSVGEWMRDAIKRHCHLQLMGALCLLLMASCSYEGAYPPQTAQRHEATESKPFNWGAAMRAMGNSGRTHTDCVRDGDRVNCETYR